MSELLRKLLPRIFPAVGDEEVIHATHHWEDFMDERIAQEGIEALSPEERAQLFTSRAHDLADRHDRGACAGDAYTVTAIASDVSKLHTVDPDGNKIQNNIELLWTGAWNQEDILPTLRQLRELEERYFGNHHRWMSWWTEWRIAHGESNRE